MIRTMNQLLENASKEEILSAMQAALDNTNESPFWAKRVIPYANALLSVLVPLRDQHLLFTPEGKPQEILNKTLLLNWCDLVSLKSLAFTLQKSNQADSLVRTKIDAKIAERFETVDLELLATYLSNNSIHLENETEDFPIANYNLHVGVTSVISQLL
ncbi:MAG: hypothetical protein DRG24_05950 [Epsilonproteobacteria bacterium]|nr:MAG: hypothetical protein DRG24_05950 [Campylobacterota bacterium]